MLSLDSKTSFGKDKGNPGVKRFHDGKQKDSKRQSLNNGGSSDVENMMRSQVRSFMQIEFPKCI